MTSRVRSAYARRVWRQADRHARLLQREGPPTFVAGWKARTQYCLVVAFEAGVLRSGTCTMVFPQVDCAPLGWSRFLTVEGARRARRERAAARRGDSVAVLDAVRPLWQIVDAEERLRHAS